MKMAGKWIEDDGIVVWAKAGRLLLISWVKNCSWDVTGPSATTHHQTADHSGWSPQIWLCAMPFSYSITVFCRLLWSILLVLAPCTKPYSPCGHWPLSPAAQASIALPLTTRACSLASCCSCSVLGPVVFYYLLRCMLLTVTDTMPFSSTVATFCRLLQSVLLVVVSCTKAIYAHFLQCSVDYNKLFYYSLWPQKMFYYSLRQLPSASIHLLRTGHLC